MRSQVKKLDQKRQLALLTERCDFHSYLPLYLIFLFVVSLLPFFSPYSLSEHHTGLHFYFNIGPKHVFVQSDFAMLMGSSREQQISFPVNTTEPLLNLSCMYCSKSWGCWFRCIINRVRCHSWGTGGLPPRLTALCSAPPSSCVFQLSRSHRLLFY